MYDKSSSVNQVFNPWSKISEFGKLLISFINLETAGKAPSNPAIITLFLGGFDLIF